MKVFIAALILGFTGSFAQASTSCGGVDKIVSDAKQGLASGLDVLKAIDCILTPESDVRGFCKSRVAVREDIFGYTQDLFSVGEVTREELDLAKASLEQVRIDCDK